MSIIAWAILATVACVVYAPRVGAQYGQMKKPPAPQPRTKEEARRWRADWEARK